MATIYVVGCCTGHEKDKDSSENLVKTFKIHKAFDDAKKAKLYGEVVFYRTIRDGGFARENFSKMMENDLPVWERNDLYGYFSLFERVRSNGIEEWIRVIIYELNVK